MRSIQHNFRTDILLVLSRVKSYTNMIHRHYKKLRERKILLTALVLILLGVLMVVYLNISSVSIVGNPQIVATNTPAINKARSVTEPVISVTPLSIQQGEPALITVEGLTSTSGVKSFTIDNLPQPVHSQFPEFLEKYHGKL